jgi:hypothetical protein
MYCLVDWALESLLSIVKYTGIVTPRKDFPIIVIKGEQEMALTRG